MKLESTLLYIKENRAVKIVQGQDDKNNHHHDNDDNKLNTPIILVRQHGSEPAIELQCKTISLVRH